ncbi:HET domain-containing protein [Mollisia scopiformis]|uniref:HET domain-containing protein n=1 Tax=Mollisia scopiformis TaxID=149040 RepID=A0A194X6W3_MOLSC|nr:HET domain-containing protein [Mollisia scopiformis]KUJ15824.1 HET domain-containing protein [Mollisia scopiformis]
MRLLELKDNGQFSLSKDFVHEVPPYAILSHTWGADDEETKIGYRKIGKQAARDDLHYFWVDTCCIDKANSTELSEAINSMFRWYQDAVICYVYLSDVKSDSELEHSRWFKRGWTLQELLAPKDLTFYNHEWQRISRSNLTLTNSRITGIPKRILFRDIVGEYSAAQIMSWAAGRETTREEDIAYCLLGLLGVNMPLLYSEGARAFQRLQQEFIKTSTDHSLFNWQGNGVERGPFARSPAEFQDCNYVSIGKQPSLEFLMTNRGLRISLPLMSLGDGNVAAVLNCYGLGGFRLAIYLKNVRDDVYRRVRSTEMIRRLDRNATIPLPRTISIESAVPRLFGRDRQTVQSTGFQFQVNFEAASRLGFRLKHCSPGKVRRKYGHIGLFEIETCIDLMVDCSGEYSGLLFNNVEKNRGRFVMIADIHKWKLWLDITKIGTDETFESVMEEYYHYSKAHNFNADRCRCHWPWEALNRVSFSLCCGLLVEACVKSGEVENQFKVELLVKDGLD